MIANTFNNYFINIGPKLANQIKNPVNKSFRDFLTLNNGLDFQFYHVKRKDIANVIDHLHAKLSYGTDGISTVLLKRMKDRMIELLSIIVNQTLSIGIFPDRLKIAKIIPLFKKEENTLLTIDQFLFSQHPLKSLKG